MCLVWKINYTEKTLRSLRKMDKHNARRIIDYLSKRVAPQGRTEIVK